MKNMKVAVKLIVSFLIVIALAIVVGIAGIFGMYMMNVADDNLYNGNYIPTTIADDISQAVVEQRTSIRNLIIYDVNEDSAIFKQTETDLEANKKTMERLIAEYDPTTVVADDRAAFNDTNSRMT